MGYQQFTTWLRYVASSGILRGRSRVGDEDSRYEGVEIKQSSPFKLMRTLAKEYGYRPLKAINSSAPGGRTCLMWTLMGGDDKGGLEAIGIVADVKRASEGEYVIPCSTIFGLDM